MLNLQKEWVLITGASSGLGKQMAYLLAKNYQANLVLCARRVDLLSKLQEELESTTKSLIEVLPLDLTDLKAVKQKIPELLERRPIRAAILNAGITYFGEHLQLSEDQMDQILHTNLTSFVYIVHALLREFDKQHFSCGIMMVASMGGVIPLPYQALYSATKAFIVNFGCAVSQELKNPKCSLTILAPGGIETEMTQSIKFLKMRKHLAPANIIAQKALHAFCARKLFYTPGILNQVTLLLSRILPRKFLLHQVKKLYFQSLKDYL